LSPWIVAHRGAMAEAPENTRAAFERALDYPIDGIELDVQLSRDGVAVVFHDASLKKINGVRKPVSAYSYHELCQMDWGAWFSADFAGEPILTLEETLERYGRQTRLLIEIKTDGASGDRISNRNVAHTVVDLVTTVLPSHSIDQMMVLSFNPDIIETAMRRAPKLTYGLNLKTEKFPRRDWPVRLYAASLPIHRITARFVAGCQSRELQVMTYSCNTEAQLDQALGLGVRVIMTDDPGKISSRMNR